tara:strand:- start:3483 stop:4343 length:861 start_codon:yes stop_codon:yes gene_type:complete
MFIINDINFNELKKYMLSNIDKNSNNVDENNKPNDNKPNDNKPNNKLNVSKNLLYIDYNKAKRKYNNNLKYKEDTFFWCFYNLLNINELNKFNEFNEFNKFNEFNELKLLKIEKDTKILLLEELRKNKNKIKKKYKLNVLEDELLNSKKICFNTFCGLCCLKDINIFITTNNNTYSYFLNNDELIENNMLNSYNLFNFIELKYNNSLINVKNNTINNINISENEYKNIVNNHFYLENLEKPLKTISYYKLDDLINICNKLNIIIFNSANKKKTKKELYSNILNILT